MQSLFLSDVGDGLNLLINEDDHSELTVDFGGSKNLDYHRCFDDNFLLSHFHADHYNGILNLGRRGCWHLKKFYHPFMPKFKESKNFEMCMLAMNIRISKNHPLQHSILRLVKSLNRFPDKLNFIPVSQGDSFTCGKYKYDVLWPPKELTEEETLRSIRTAIDDFNKAKQEDVDLKRIYDGLYEQTADKEINRDYLLNEEMENPILKEVPEINENVMNANDSLRKAANRLSIAFRQEDNILFLGDLERTELRLVVDSLAREKKLRYDILIAAHHGTHWQKSLDLVSAEYCLASVGKRLRKYIKYDYLNSCRKFIRTDEFGDIIISRKLKLR